MNLGQIFESVAVRTMSKNNFKIAIIENMQRLSEVIDKNEFVLDHFHDATADAFGVENKEKGHDGVKDHVLNVSMIAVCYNKNTVLGFASIKKFIGVHVFYVHGIATRMKMQGTGIGNMMISRLLLDNPEFEFLSFTSQSPVVHQLMKRYCSGIYPTLNFYQPIPMTLQKIGTNLMRSRKGSFNPENFISQDLYSNCLYGHGIPMSKDIELNRWFENSLRITSGMSNDGFLFLGKIR